MTIQDKLDQRYGRRRPTAARWRTGIAIAVAVLVVLVFAWWAYTSALDDVDADTTGFDLVDQRTVQVSFQFTSPPGRAIACALEAQDEEHGVVGWKVVEYAASEQYGRAFVETIPTTAEATTGFVNSCWVT